MKYNLFRLLIALTMACVLSIGCAGLTTKQKIGISCESAASALDTLTAAKVAGKVSQAQLQDAIRIYEASVVPVCVPVAENVSAIQSTVLAAALAELTRRAGGVR